MANWVLIVLYILSFALPTLGFVRLLRRAGKALSAAEAKVAERGNATLNAGDFREVWEQDVTYAPRRQQADLVWDTVLVGAGLLAGAIAGIASLY